MKEGAILLARLQQADGQSKLRPVLILLAMPPHGDWLVCGISSQLHQEVVGFDQIIASGNADFFIDPFEDILGHSAWFSRHASRLSLRRSIGKHFAHTPKRTPSSSGPAPG